MAMFEASLGDCRKEKGDVLSWLVGFEVGFEVCVYAFYCFFGGEVLDDDTAIIDDGLDDLVNFTSINVL